MKVLEIFAFWREEGEEKDVATMASNVLKSCQLTDIIEFWCVIWRQLTPNFSYDCDMVLETSDKHLNSSALAESSATVGQTLTSYCMPGTRTVTRGYSAGQ